MTPDVVSVRPDIWHAAKVFSLFIAFFALRAALSRDTVDRWILVGGTAFLIAALVILRRLFVVTITSDTVMVRQPLRTVSISTDELRSVSAKALSRRPPMWALTLVGADGTHTTTSMTFVAVAERRRLLAAIEQRTAPGVVRRDDALPAMIAEEDPTPD
ncbi:hypothetical protein [Streptomyces griseus]|uniref:hypothetical protein n=1 Tax=Streptomyces griseus TaxID=1911 RepID=UPI000564CDAD|nr:hypothetical protein [Streptomyces griseus]